MLVDGLTIIASFDVYYLKDNSATLPVSVCICTTVRYDTLLFLLGTLHDSLFLPL